VPPGHNSPQNTLQNAGANRAAAGIPGDDQVSFIIVMPRLHVNLKKTWILDRDTQKLPVSRSLHNLFNVILFSYFTPNLLLFTELR
jgi:hypothetical protein